MEAHRDSVAKGNNLTLSMRMATTTQVFERFEGIDIRQSTFHGLVETMRERRDLTERGIMIMLANKNMQERKGKPTCKIQLYPDDRFGMDPIYDSEEVTWAQPSIAEDLEALGDLADLIEDDFLELECEVIIEFDEGEENIEDYKEEQPIGSIRRGTQLVLDAKASSTSNGSAYVVDGPLETEEDPGSPRFFAKLASRRFSLLTRAVAGERRKNMIQKRPNKQEESDEEGVGKNVANSFLPRSASAEGEEEKPIVQE